VLDALGEVVDEEGREVLPGRQLVLLADVGAGAEAHQHRGVVLADRGEHLVLVLTAGQVDHRGAGREHLADDLRPVGLHRDQGLAGELLDHGQQLLQLALGADPVGVVAAGLGAEVDDGGALRGLHPALAHRGLGRPRDALAVGRVGGQVHHAHQGRHPVGEDHVLVDVDRLDRSGEVVGVPLVELGQGREADHPVESRERLGSVRACESSWVPTYPCPSCTPRRRSPGCG
jgi:hypothetical protein